MKYLVTFFLFSFLALGTVTAQTGILKNKKITNDELPAAIGAAFKKDFPTQLDGSWSVFFTQHLNGNAVAITPKWYIFSVKGDHKAMAQYSPNGKLEKSKGMGNDTGEDLAGAAKSSSKGSN
jgi:hypothetical protein